MNNLEKTVAKAFLEMAECLQSGTCGHRPKIALTGMGGEHGEENAVSAALMASKRGVNVCYIGSVETEGIGVVRAENEAEGHKKMEEMLGKGEVDGAITMHYPFPVGVSTVGRVITPAKGKEMFVANTTGTSATHRAESIVKNAICGIIAAKACGVKKPTVGILNVDGARQAEMALRALKDGGYDISWATSSRADGGAIMRGNDVLQGSADVMVTDSLTGNMMMKMLSAYTTGGSFESLGFGYGPGIGKGYRKLILIISRASGAPVIANALEYAAQLVQGKVFDVAEAEYASAERAGLSKILESCKTADKSGTEDVKCPPAEPVTDSISGIEVMALEDAAKALWKAGIYAETGMGCTGPLVMMSPANRDRAEEILKAGGFIS